jgi:hypothetical protein
VFDANAHMRNLLQDPAPEPVPVPVPDIPPLAKAEPAPDPEPGSVQDSGSYDWGGVIDGDSQQPESKLQEDSFLEKSPQELIAATPANLHDEAVEMDDLPISVFPMDAMQNEPADRILPSPEEAASVSFMTAKPSGRTQSRGVRGLWLAALAFLLVALGLQFVVHERDRLAAGQPALKPALLALCDVLSCKINALKQIESIVIDSSTFSKVQPDVYKLSVTLKNNARLDVAKPSLELTLTDSQDQAVIRKVIAPADLGDKVAVIAQADEVSWVIPITVKQAQGSAPVTGYRILAFYP